MRRLFLLATAVFLQLFILSPVSAHAQGLPPGYTDTVTVAPQTSGYYINDLGTLIGSISAWIAGISALILFAYLIWGGISIISSGGDKSKTEAGRTRITQSIIGFAILASIYAIYGVLLNFTGLRSKVDIGNFGRGGGSGTGTTQSGSTTSCGGVAINSQANDGGAGGYCSSGAAIVRCMAPGTGTKPVSTVPYFDPCYCINGVAAQKSGYTFGCTP